MKNHTASAQEPFKPFQISRRKFLLSAAGASLMAAMASASQAKRLVTADSLVRVGLIGRDGHTDVLLDSIPKMPRIRLAAFAKGQAGEDSAWIQEHPACTRQTHVYEDYREMLEKEELDVVGVCPPYYQNAEASIQAARQGIHVLSEKPAATNLEDLDRLERQVRWSGVRYSIMLTMRAMPVFQAARMAIRQGAVGEPILISSQKSYKYGAERPWFYKERKTYGGTIPWVGIHAFDYMRWVSGQEYAQVAAHHGNKAHPQAPGCEDHAGLLFRLVNGGTAVCHLDYLRPETAPTHGDARLRIAGKEGVLEVRENEDQVHLISSKGRTGELPLPPAVDLFAAFVAELRGEGQHLISADEAFSITRICLKAREAADSGKWVTL